MRIGIDARAYGWSGLGRYVRNLLRFVTALPEAPEFVVFAPRAYARDIAALPRVRVVPVVSSYYSLQEQTLFLAALLKHRVELMHFLHFNAPVFYRRSFVVTIHDLTRFLFPAQKHAGLLHQWAYEEVFRAAILHARRVIAVSEHTRNDLLRFFPDVVDRVVVIPEGVEHDRYRPAADPAADDAVLERLGVIKPYLLFVGVWMNHKNLPRLLDAFADVRRKGFLGKLVITGKGRPHDEDVPGLVQRSGLTANVILPGNVAEEFLPSLYRRASAFVFPSLYEGFGLPPLEAMACGVPVVASHVASIPEVLGDAAEFVDPLSSDDIARGILRVLSDVSCREHLIAKGLERVRRYHWQRCAAETFRVYVEVVKEERSPVRTVV